MTEAPIDPDKKIVAVPLEEARGKIVAVPLDEARSVRGESIVALPRSKVAGLRAFRRIRADRFFGFLGILILIAGLILAFTWPEPPAKVEPKYKVEWPETMAFTFAKTETLEFTGLRPDQKADCKVAPPAPPCPTKPAYTFTVDKPNVTKVVFWLSWKDDIGDEGEAQSEGDTFSLKVSGPGFEPTEAMIRTGGPGGQNVSLSLPESSIPDLGSVPARTEPEAWKAVNADPRSAPNRTGVGEWKFTVSLLRAGDDWDNTSAMNQYRDSAPCAPNYCVKDTKNDYTFHFEYWTYSAAVKPA